MTIGCPLSRTDLSCDLCDGCAEGGEPVEDGDTDLDLCNLTVEVSRGQRCPRSLTQCILVSARLQRWYAGQFRVLQAGDAGLRMQPSYHAGFTR